MAKYWTTEKVSHEADRCMPLFDGRQLGHISQNYSRYDEPEVNDAIDRALLASTAEAADAAWAEAVPAAPRKSARPARRCEMHDA